LSIVPHQAEEKPRSLIGCRAGEGTLVGGYNPLVMNKRPGILVRLLAGGQGGWLDAPIEKRVRPVVPFGSV